MENEKIVKSFFESFKAGNKEEYTSLCDDKIEWITMKSMPAGGTYSGKEAIFERYFPTLLSKFTEFHADPKEYFADKDNVIVLGRYHGSTNSGNDFDVPFCHIYTIKNKKIVKFRQFTDTLMINESLTL